MARIVHIVGRRCGWPGAPGDMPMGHVVDGEGRLAVNEAERAKLLMTRELRGEGKSLRAIAATLDAAGRPPRGNRWHVETLSRIVAG